MRSFTLLALVLALLALAGCVPKPKQNYSLAQIGRLDSLEELMRINAHTVDHLFSIRYQPIFSAPEKAAAERAGERIMATAVVIKERFSAKRPKGFAALAGRLTENGRDLLVGAQADRAEDITTALDEMRETCKACHAKYR